MDILVTGADGILGNNLVRMLLERGHKVRTLVQSGMSAPLLEELPVDMLYGDIRNNDDVNRAVKGMEIIIHAAAKTDTWPCRHQSYWDVNVGGTTKLVEAARKQGARRFLHIGTANSFGPGSASEPGTETSPYSAGKYRLDYISSKYEAHRLVLSEVKKGLDAVVFNPTFMIGAYDAKPSSGAMIIAINRRKVPGYPSGGRNFVYVKDVAGAIINGMDSGRRGESYILGNQNLKYREAFDLIAQTLGVKAPRLRLPDNAALVYGYSLGILSRLLRFKPSVNYSLACISTEDHFYSARKAVVELKMNQTPILFALEEAVNWFRANKYI